MATSRPPLLVSCVNRGGLFFAGTDGVEQWSKVDTTGLAWIPGGCLLARQAEGRAELRRWLDGDVQRIEITGRSLDLHDLCWHQDRLLVVATQINTVLEFDAGFGALRHWSLPGEEDSQHINSICVHGGRILASRFGPFKRHRGYSGRSRDAGEVFDVETGEVVIGGLSQPHSLTPVGDSLWLCDSETSRVLEYRDGRLLRERVLDGYTRGLAIDGGRMFVGLSRSRNADAGGRAHASVVELDLATLQPLGGFDLPVDEVYDVRVVAESDIPLLRKAAFRDAVLEFDTQVHERNLAVDAARRDAELALQERDAVATLYAHVDALDARGRESDAEARAAARAQARAEAERDEAGEWAARLDRALGEAIAAAEAAQAALAERDQRIRLLAAALADAAERGAALEDGVAARDALLAQHAQWRDGIAVAEGGRAAAIAERDARIASLQGFIATVTGSRSWRWTRPLRRVEPMAPTPDALPAIALLPPPPDWPPLPTLPQAEAIAPAPLPAVTLAAAATFAAPVPVRPSRATLAITDLAFPEHVNPEVSILIATFGGFDRVRRCLSALQADDDTPDFEVIVVEDGSGDEEVDRLATVPGLRYLRNDRNLGYLRSMNAAAAHVRGRYMVLLNDDCVPRPGWLRALLDTFSLNHDCGVAGARLMYPDGRQQESGGIVWNDGSACNHGLGETAWRVQDACVREVDYVSAAAAMIPTVLWREVDGFDDAYAPAFYEDTDLAFRLRVLGYRSLYQPASEVVHEGGASYGTDEAHHGKHHQALNRARFRERWDELLVRDQMPPGQHPFLARVRGQRRTTVLLVDQSPPRPERDAGSRAIWQLLQQLQRLDLDVRFWSERPIDDPLASALLAIHGYELFDAERVGAAFDTWYAAHAAYFDVVVLSRAATADACMASVRRHGDARVLYYGHDIHFQRLARQAQITGDQDLAAAVSRLQLIEQAAWRDADDVLYPTDLETAHVRTWLRGEGLPESRARTVPLLAFATSPVGTDEAAAGPGDRRDVLFVGGFAHAPNADGIEWFLREAWPRVRRQVADARLVVIGADPPESLLTLAAGDIVIAGAVDEATLHAHYTAARVVVAPLRFGAGLKGKVVEAMHHGVPCVTTAIGAEGLEDATALRVADAADPFAEAVIALLRDDGEWQWRAAAGQALVAERFSPTVQREFWSLLLGDTGYADVALRLQRLRRGAAAAPA